jgi:PTS system galactitol-specific IIA component
MLTIKPEFVLQHIHAKDSEEVIQLLSDLLYEGGCVSPAYAQATIARERAHPTGLPTKPCAVAIPHADAEGVHESAMAIATLAEPVGFLNMADPEETLAVEIVLMIANNSPQEQVKTLRKLADIFCEPDKLIELQNLSAPDQIAEWMKKELELA